MVKVHGRQSPRCILIDRLIDVSVPPNGLVIYCGTIVTDEGKEKKVNIDFEPFRPINTSLYLCDNKFHTEVSLWHQQMPFLCGACALPRHIFVTSISKTICHDFLWTSKWFDPEYLTKNTPKMTWKTTITNSCLVVLSLIGWKLSVSQFVNAYNIDFVDYQ